MWILGRIFLVIALVFLAWDVWTAGEGGVVLVDLGKRWHQIHGPSLQLVEAGISRHVSQWLWDHIALPVLLTPAFLVFLLPWLFFSLFSWLIARRRARMEDW